MNLPITRNVCCVEENFAARSSIDEFVRNFIVWSSQAVVLKTAITIQRLHIFVKLEKGKIRPNVNNQSNQIKSNQINQIKSNQIKSNQINQSTQLHDCCRIQTLAAKSGRLLCRVRANERLRRLPTHRAQLKTANETCVAECSCEAAKHRFCRQCACEKCRRPRKQFLHKL